MPSTKVDSKNPSTAKMSMEGKNVCFAELTAETAHSINETFYTPR